MSSKKTSSSIKNDSNVSTSTTSNTISNSTASSDSETVASENVDENVETCPICLDTLIETDQIGLVCKHKFCTICIKTWIETVESCPLCKQITIPEFDMPSVIEHSSETTATNSLSDGRTPILLSMGERYKCPAKGCKQTLLGENIREHYGQKHSKSLCKFCSRSVQIQLMNKHESRCQKSFVSCPSEGCLDVVPRDVQKAIIAESATCTRVRYEGNEYDCASRYSVLSHGCAHVSECVICHRVYRNKDALIRHCAALHPNQISEALKLKKRKSALDCMVNIKRVRDEKKSALKAMTFDDDDDNIDNDNDDDSDDSIENDDDDDDGNFYKNINNNKTNKKKKKNVEKEINLDDCDPVINNVTKKSKKHCQKSIVFEDDDDDKNLDDDNVSINLE